MNPDADVSYQTVNLFSSDKCFTYFISDVSTTPYNSDKGRCTRYMWSNYMFVLWNFISANFYEDV